MLSAQYRSPINFPELIEQAASAGARLYTSAARTTLPFLLESAPQRPMNQQEQAFAQRGGQGPGTISTRP